MTASKRYHVLLDFPNTPREAYEVCPPIAQLIESVPQADKFDLFKGFWYSSVGSSMYVKFLVSGVSFMCNLDISPKEFENLSGEQYKKLTIATLAKNNILYVEEPPYQAPSHTRNSKLAAVVTKNETPKRGFLSSLKTFLKRK